MTDYCTKAELQQRLWPDDASPSEQDLQVMAQIIEGVSKQIESLTGRRFYASTETRYYTAEDGDDLEVDDLLSVTSLSCDEDGDRTYERTWAATDYDLLPENATLDGRPYTHIHITPRGNYAFPVGIRKGVKIVGSFGYGATIPAMVREACLLQCERLIKRKDAPFGIAGSIELGQMRLIPELDPDVKILLMPYMRMW